MPTPGSGWWLGMPGLGTCRCPAARQQCASCQWLAALLPACMLILLAPWPLPACLPACLPAFLTCSKDMTLKEAEVLALSTLKQVMEEKVGGRAGGWAGG